MGITARISDGIRASVIVHYRYLVIGHQTNARTMEPSCHVAGRELANASNYMDAIGLAHCEYTVTRISSRVFGS